MAEPRLGAAGIGPRRTGTTWLDACLRAHPELCLPAEVKETFFLDERFERGWDWYWDHFEECDEEALRAEVGSTWFDDPRAADRLHAHNPACRILATLRDPAERSWSHFLHHRRKGRAGEDFRQAAARCPGIVGASRYARHLPRWIERFGRERVRVILLEDVAERPESVLEAVCGFLGVEPFPGVPDAAHRRVNPGGEARRPTLARWAAGASRWLRARGHHKVVDAVKRAAGGLVYDEGAGRPALPEELRAELVRAFEEDVGYVEELTGRTLEGWRSP